MMKINLVMVCVLAATFKCEKAVSEPTTVKNAAGPEIGQDTTPNIVPGSGVIVYGFRNYTVAPRVCYNANVSFLSAPEALLELPISVHNIRLILGNRDEKYERYLRSVDDTNVSISLNYYFSISRQDVHVQVLGYGLGALNEDGKKIYDNGGNPQFQSLCGNQIIKSIQEGVLLISTLTIKFDSVDSKRNFKKEAKGILSLANAEAVIKSAVQKSKISGLVTTQALQIGGKPSSLSKILNRDSAGYYAVTCNLTAIDDCIKATTSFLDYAKNDFSKQFSIDNDRRFGVVPLDFSWRSISFFGLKPPASPDA